MCLFLLCTGYIATFGHRFEKRANASYYDTFYARHIVTHGTNRIIPRSITNRNGGIRFSRRRLRSSRKSCSKFVVRGDESARRTRPHSATFEVTYLGNGGSDEKMLLHVFDSVCRAEQYPRTSKKITSNNRDVDVNRFDDSRWRTTSDDRASRRIALGSKILG